MDRFFLPPENWPEAELRGEEAHHCARVMRKTAGDELEVFDGRGRWARAEVAGIESGAVRLDLGETGRDRVITPQVTLAVAIPKGKTMDLVVQKAVELGVARIRPLLTEHTVVKAGDASRKRDKWQRVALEACKQCGQNLLPMVEGPCPLDEWLPQRSGDAAALIASLSGGAGSLRGVLRGFEPRPAQVELLVGPEGDFTPGEVAAAVESGFAPVSLGPLVLRVETAALFLLGALRYEFSEG
jgi:16S rRNA (uracil1498-N3)-methyltransferase